jgi:microcin C transport system substrate-binding protein
MRKFFLLGLLLLAGPAWAGPVPGIAMTGDVKYPPNFTHFDYVNPDAPKGGAIKLAAVGSFDSLNPFILKGVPAVGLGLLFDTLLESAADEPFSEYGLLAESIEMPDNRAWVIFNLRPQAKFADGTPVLAADVQFTFDTLKTKGNPQYRLYYANVAKVEILGQRRIKFLFKSAGNRELPLILGQMQILSQRYYQQVEFQQTTLVPPLGSGPYRLTQVDPGRSVTYERDPNYWGRDLPVNRGRYNFAAIRYDYYRDGKIALEAFKSGEYDFRQENVAKDWATAYDFPALQRGLVIKAEIPHEIPTGMQGFAMNLRRPLFQDVRVRQALALAFDFEWSNRALFFNAYTRTRSYFSNSELAARGLPDAAELAVLEPYRAQLPSEVFTTEYNPPKTDGSGQIRDNLKQAQDLLRQAGYALDGEMLQKDGKKLRFEILANSPAFERILLPFANNLKKLGIQADIRTVDAAQYQKRMQEFDYDMTVAVIPQSLSPGNEQRNYWSSKAAATPGSDNIMGIASPLVDTLVEKLIAAQSRQELVTLARVLDRVLLAGHYIIPNWHIRTHRVVYWDMFKKPTIAPKYALGFVDTWWVDAAKAQRLQQQKSDPEKTMLPVDAERGARGGWLALGLLVVLGLILALRRTKA